MTLTKKLLLTKKISSALILSALVSYLPASNARKKSSGPHTRSLVVFSKKTAIAVIDAEKIAGPNYKIKSIKVVGSRGPNRPRSSKVLSTNRLGQFCTTNESKVKKNNCKSVLDSPIIFDRNHRRETFILDKPSRQIKMVFINTQLDRSDGHNSKTSILITAEFILKKPVKDKPVKDKPNKDKPVKDKPNKKDGLVHIGIKGDKSVTLMNLEEKNTLTLNITPEGSDIIVHFNNPFSSKKARGKDRFYTIEVSLVNIRKRNGNIVNPVYIQSAVILDHNRNWDISSLAKRTMGKSGDRIVFTGKNLKFTTHKDGKNRWMPNLKISARSLGHGNAKLILKAIPHIKK